MPTRRRPVGTPAAWALAACTVAAGAAPPAPAIAQDAARYLLEIELYWSRATHPHEFPDDPHLSDLIGAAHGPGYTMFADGATASSGLELVAENGRTTILRAELAEAARRDRAGAPFMVEGIAAPGTMRAEIAVAAPHDRVSFVTMLAPSPDWFTGLAGVVLRDGAQWRDRVEATLWAWDAGTDSGATYAAANADTQPRQSVRLLATPHMLTDTGLAPLGIARLTRLP